MGRVFKKSICLKAVVVLDKSSTEPNVVFLY